MGGDLVMPGMVNPHCHMTMTLFRGLGEDVDDRLFRYVLPLERQCITPETVEIGTRLAALELIRGWRDHRRRHVLFRNHRRPTSWRKPACVASSARHWRISTHRTTRASTRPFALTEELAETFAGHPLVTASIAPHAPYSTDIPVMARIAEWSDAHPDVPVQLHMAEMVSENEWARTHARNAPGSGGRHGRPAQARTDCRPLPVRHRRRHGPHGRTRRSRRAQCPLQCQGRTRHRAGRGDAPSAASPSA